MSEDLQSEDISEEPTEASESGADTGATQEEKVTFDEKQQAKVDDLIGQKVRQARQAERDTADLQRQLDEAKAKIPVEQRPDVAASGDIDDVDYENQRTQREAQIRTQAEFDARVKFDADATQAAQLAEQQRQQLAFQDSVNKFNGTATKFGIDQQSLSVMDQTISSYGGLNPAVGEFVLNDEQGMLIYQHMSNNPEDIFMVNNMSPMQAGIFLTEVKAKQAALNTKKTSDAPAPADRPDGGGVDIDAGKYPYSKNAVFT